MEKQKTSKRTRRASAQSRINTPHQSDAQHLAAELAHVREELRQRTAELEIINSVQQGLATQVHVQDIYDLIGDKIRDIFNAQVVMISTYDPPTDTVTHRYAIERGKRVYVTEPQPPGGFRRRIIASGEPLLVNTQVIEQATTLGQPTLPGTEPPRSWLGVPMRVGTRVTGVMSLQNLDQENAFDESDLRLLQTLASSMSVAIENARLFHETNRLLKETEQRAAELAIINSVQATLASKLNLQEIYEAVADKIRENFHNTDLSIRIYDPQTGLLHLPYNYEYGRRVTIDPLPLAERGFSRHVIRTGETVVINENMAQANEQYGSYVLPGEHLPKSSVFVPLMVGGQARGLIRLKNLECEHAFNESDVRLLQTLANAMSVALENARLFDETQRLLKETEQRAAELATVNRVSHALASQVELEALIQLAGQQIRDTFNADIAYIALLDSASQWIRFPYTFGETFTPIQFGEGLTSKIIETRQPLLINRDMENRRAQIGATQVGIDVKAYVGVPILAGAQAIGVVSVQGIHQEDLFDENDQHLLMTIAANVGVAIERAQRFQTEKRRAEQFQLIAEIGRNIASLLDTNQIMEQVTQLLSRVFHYYHVGIGLIEGDEVVYRIGAGVLWDDPHFGFKPQRLRIGMVGLSGWVAAHGQSLLVPDVSQEPRYVEMQGGATRSELVVPIIVKEQVIGVLDVQSDQLNTFDSTDLAVVQSIANQTGIAIENARLYERAQELAVMQERTRLARDLHDAVTQTLFSASLIADALPLSWESDPTEGRRLLKELRQLSRGALAEMRTLLLELRPTALVETKLGDLLRQLGEAATGRTGLSIAVQVEGNCKLPPEAHIALYRIAQEALNNVLKHSRAAHVTMSLNCTLGQANAILVAEMSIRDDGRGFDINHVSASHLGLGNMRERAQAIGAELTIQSGPGRGTEIKVVWDHTPRPIEEKD
ncbi:MAG: GAF domain-containing sensor histidine kinase [Anaerolineae bacterium]